jgi:hypothetical protein
MQFGLRRVGALYRALRQGWSYGHNAKRQNATEGAENKAEELGRTPVHDCLPPGNSDSPKSRTILISGPAIATA